MNNPINNSLFDSRDLLEYKDYLELNIDSLDEINHYEEVKEFLEKLYEAVGTELDFGTIIIHEDYFTEYTEEYLSIEIDNLPSIISYHIDWDGVAGELLHDYYGVEYKGSTYYVRCV
jgi:hypothetical protein